MTIIEYIHTAGVKRVTALWPLTLLFCLSTPAAITIADAQTAPNAGTVPRQIERERLLELPAISPPLFLPPPPMESVGRATVTVIRLTFAGNGPLTATPFSQAVAGFVGRPLTFVDVRTTTRYYIQDGAVSFYATLFDTIGGGANAANITFEQDHYDLSGSPNEGAAPAATDAARSFPKLILPITRQQRLTPRDSLFPSLAGQLSSKNRKFTAASLPRGAPPMELSIRIGTQRWVMTIAQR